jgi:hypothetical protein
VATSDDGQRYEQIREAVLVALDQYYSPLTLDELVAVVRELGAPELSVAGIEDLLSREEQAFDAGQQRAVWLCPGLEPPDFYPDTDFVCRSDWQPENRIVQFDLEPERRMWVLRQVSEQVLGCLDERKDPAPLADAFAVLLREIPEDVLRDRVGAASVDVRDEDAVQTVRELAEDLHAGLEVGPRRRDLAAGVGQLDQRARIFGRQTE